MDGIDHHQRRLGDAERAAGVTEKVRESRGVDDVDFDREPLGVSEVGGERVVPRDLFVVDVGNGGAVVHPSQSIDRSGAEEHGGGQLRLSASAMSDNGDVADGGGLIHLHRGILLLRRQGRADRERGSGS